MTDINADLYKQIIAVMPVLCVDVIVRTRGRYLLVKRAMEPLKGSWWVVGGRVQHGEPAHQAARRKLREETGIAVDADALRYVGYFEGTFDRNALGLTGLYHTIGLVFEVSLADLPTVVLDGQSDAWCLAERLPTTFVVVPAAGTAGDGVVHLVRERE